MRARLVHRLGSFGLIAVVGVLTGTAAAAPPGARSVMVERRLALMGTGLRIEVEAVDRAAGLAASERAVAALEAAEARLSTWRAGTELARLNRAPEGHPWPLSPALAADLEGALSCAAATGGAFDPTVGPLVAAWNLRRGGRVPDPAELAAARAATGHAGLRLADGAATRLRPGLAVEEGGFGKGAGLRDALTALAADPAVERALLDLGGQIAVFRRTAAPGASGWRVAVADPRRRDREVLEIAVDGGSVSTSGNSERCITVDGVRLGHLLDPRTGRPAPDFGSVTVWAADPLVADCLSTGLYVLGPEAAVRWAASHPEVEVLVLRDQREQGGRLQALASPGLRGRLTPLTPPTPFDNEIEIEIEFGGTPAPAGK
ncbi:MAG TPA: FAD:protein FMN transferase [Thermoanaerobaculia bacterium]|nr:FAD:protein FMN transferase [Thermoanaerobaculia bacterium]